MASPATGTVPVVGYLHAFDLRRRRAQVQIAAATLSGNSLRQTVHIHRASVHQVARVIAGLAESNGSLPPGLWLTSPAGWLPRTRISSGTLRSAIECGLTLPFRLPYTSMAESQAFTFVVWSGRMAHSMHARVQVRELQFVEFFVQSWSVRPRARASCLVCNFTGLHDMLIPTFTHRSETWLL